MNKLLLPVVALSLIFASCKKEGCTDETAQNYNPDAKKDDGSCTFLIDNDGLYEVPTSYSFADGAGNSTVDYSGQTDRLDQLSEIVTKIKSGAFAQVYAQDLKDMFANTGGNGNGNFSFSSTKQLRDKCFSLDVNLFESIMDSVEAASANFAVTASNGQSGILTSGTSTYLVGANGMDYAEIIEKGVMGAVFMHQALNHYLDGAQMNVDNTSAVDAANGKYYTQMAHHWDEAFGYFGVPTDFPTSPATRFWGKYCNSQNANLGSNAVMMNNFLKGRAAIANNVYSDRDAAIQEIRLMWENIAAHQAMKYIDNAVGYFGTDDAKFMHAVSEAYGFIWNLRYAPDATRRLSQTEVTTIVAMFGDNFWELTVQDLQTIKATISAAY